MPTPRSRAAGLLAIGLIALAGCGNNMKEQLGIAKRPPDEFTVVKRAPLEMPPDFGLRPPRPGERRPQEPIVAEQARRTLLGQTAVASGNASASRGGELALLARAGSGDVPPDIRRSVDRESAELAKDERNFVERLMFWMDYPPPGEVVDAQKEAQRLQENAALGRPTGSGETPTIERKPRSRGISIF